MSEYYGGNVSRDRVRKALSRYENAPADRHAYGIVRAVNADGSYQVALDGSVEPTRCAAFCSAAAGDRVAVIVRSDGKCDAIGRLGGEPKPDMPQQATFTSSEPNLTEEYDGWALLRLNDASAKTDGFDGAATFVDGIVTFLKDGCYELSGSVYWAGGATHGGIGVWSADLAEEQFSAFMTGDGLSHVSAVLSPVTLRVSAGESRAIRRRCVAGAGLRFGNYTWVTVKYLGS